ncbi:MAG: carboxylesterase family protein [Clostridiales Family XIII bacterium]|nr:carboxylesterase family protein [Clostridiales Family XIII bacterium]
MFHIENKYVVRAHNGTYIGHDCDGVSEFLGMRYAAPAESWKPATAPATTAADVQYADAFGLPCFQDYDPKEMSSFGEMSEDCLSLNIWTKDTNSRNKPVLVYVHGAGGVNGSSAEPLYHGATFVRDLPEGEDAVFITFNYRLNLFGMLNLEPLDGYTDEYRHSISIATLDQIQALKWIHENVEAFGGDAGNVTFMGHSYGAGTISTHLTIAESRKYFHKAYVISGPLTHRQQTVARSKEISKIVFEKLGVKTLQELLDYDKLKMVRQFNEIYAVVGQYGYHRVTDGALVPFDGFSELEKGGARDIPLMITYTDGEKDSDILDIDNIPAARTDSVEYMWKRILVMCNNSKGCASAISADEYPEVVEEFLAQGENKAERVADLRNELLFRTGSEYMLELQSRWNKNTWLGCWRWAPDTEALMKRYGDEAWMSPFGRALHTVDIAFLFNDSGFESGVGPKEEQPPNLARQHQYAVYCFAKTGNPNHEGIPEWKPFTEESRFTMMIDQEWELVRDYKSEDFRIMRKMIPNFRKNTII